MTASSTALGPTAPHDPLPETDRALVQRVNEALWQAQVQQMRSQEWFNFASDGYLLTDMHGIIHETNYAAATILEMRKGFLLGKPLGLFLTAKDRRLFYQHLSRLAERSGVERWETQVSRPGSPPRDVALTASVVPNEQGQGTLVRWMLQDVSGTREAERAWLAEKTLADCLLESPGILILLVDEVGIILRSNPFALQVSGYDPNQVQGRSWSHLLLPEKERDAGRQLLYEARANGTGRSEVLALVTRSGGHRSVQWSARKVGRMLLLIGQDVTQLQEAQRQALQAERLAAIGQMSAGLAHEGRNALQRIQACLSLLHVRLNDQPENLELLQRIQRAQDDLQRLFEDIRTYAVASRLQPRWNDIRLCWREAWKDLSNLRPSAELTEDTGETNPFCRVDSFYLKQVFRNLLENALSSGACPVRILIQCQPATLGEEEAICIRLRDNGPGIPAEARPQLFEPFFTTKLRGTGLGLAICKRIIEAHGGRIEASSDTSSGAEMVITLPRREP